MSTSSYLNFSPSYYIDLNEGHQQLYDHQVIHHHTAPLTLLSLQPHSSSFSSLSSSSPSSLLSSPIYLNPVQDQAGSFYMGSKLQPSPYQQEVDHFSSYITGSYDQTTLEINKGPKSSLKFTICKKEDTNLCGGDGGDGGGDGGASEINGSSVKWMSSKMRLMKRWMKTEEDQKQHPPPAQVVEGDTHLKNTLISRSSPNNNTNNDNTTIRVCSDCNTTKTPLWRSGPKGPKSLCNACGIRQRKARRAMAAAASGSMIPNNPSSLTMRAGNSHKKTQNNNNVFGAHKKRSKVAKPSRDHHDNFQRKLCFEEFALNLSKKLSLQQVFPQEEKEAAILLMALSCGLVHG